MTAKTEETFSRVHNKPVTVLNGHIFATPKKTWNSSTQKLNYKVSDTDYTIDHYLVQGRTYYAVWRQQPIADKHCRFFSPLTKRVMKGCYHPSFSL